MQQLMQIMDTQLTTTTTTTTVNKGPLDILLDPPVTLLDPLVMLQAPLVIQADLGLQETLPPTTLIKHNILEPILELTHLPILHHTLHLQVPTLVLTLHHHHPMGVDLVD